MIDFETFSGPHIGRIYHLVQTKKFYLTHLLEESRISRLGAILVTGFALVKRRDNCSLRTTHNLGSHDV